MAAPASILIYGLDPTLLLTRCLLLENAGFRVAAVQDANLATEALSHQPIELSILCHTLSLAECEAILAKVHSLRPETKVVLLETRGDERLISGNDSVLNVFDGPEKLLMTVKMLLHA